MNLDKIIEQQISTCIHARNSYSDTFFITSVDTLTMLFEPTVKQQINKYKEQQNIVETLESYTLLLDKIINYYFYGETWEDA